MRGVLHLLDAFYMITLHNGLTAKTWKIEAWVIYWIAMGTQLYKILTLRKARIGFSIVEWMA